MNFLLLGGVCFLILDNLTSWYRSGDWHFVFFLMPISFMIVIIYAGWSFLKKKQSMQMKWEVDWFRLSSSLLPHSVSRLIPFCLLTSIFWRIAACAVSIKRSAGLEGKGIWKQDDLNLFKLFILFKISPKRLPFWCMYCLIDLDSSNKRHTSFGAFSRL